jgi:hypothetical protein
MCAALKTPWRHTQPSHEPRPGRRVTQQRSQADGPPELHEVRLVRLPVAVHALAQEHSAELMREMYLLAQQVKETGSQQLPTRLVALVDALGSQFGGLTTDQDLQLEAAMASEETEIDLVYNIPLSAGAAAQALGSMLDEADGFCLQGQHLLTLATPPQSRLYRRWYLEQFVEQLAGLPPTPWPDFMARG